MLTVINKVALIHIILVSSRASYCTLGLPYFIMKSEWVTSKAKLKLYSEPRHANLLVSFVQQFPWMYFAKYLVYVTRPTLLLGTPIS